jgi:hypothetical protein
MRSMSKSYFCKKYTKREIGGKLKLLIAMTGNNLVY